MEKKVILSLLLLVIMSSFISAEIIITQQPKTLYNFGDSISVPATIKSSTELSGSFQMDLICDGKTANFYKNGIALSSGEEKKIDASLVLSRQAIGDIFGTCRVKASIGEDYTLTNEFKISNLININLRTTQREFRPEDVMIIEGDAIRENGQSSNGFVDLNFILDSGNATGNQTYQGTIDNGFFSVSVPFPKDIKAGKYLIKINTYEKDSLGLTTNKGFTSYEISVVQVPTSLEIVFENPEVNPGESMRVKTILHDQTGEPIEAVSILTIKDNNDKIYEQIEKPTDEFLEFPIEYNRAPAEWSVVAVSTKLTSQANFRILPNEEVSVQVINNTLFLTNVGNVPYNKTLLIKVGEEAINLNPFIEVDETKKYRLNAPDGSYSVEVIHEGESKYSTDGLSLTGKAVSVKEVSEGILGFTKYPLAWIFVIIILGFVAFMIFRKGYKKSFFGYISKIKKNPPQTAPLRKNSILETANKAELSLSLRGEKQSASLVCVKIKNLGEIEKKESSTEETLQKIIDFVEDNKGFIYENGDNLFFVFAPILTKTFKNEMTAVKTAEKIKEVLTEHNKHYKQKVSFGIAVNSGDIIAKADQGLKFMSFGSLISGSKKVSSLSNGEIYLNKSVEEKLGSNVKTEKKKVHGVEVYIVKEIRDREEHRKFIGEFMKRLERS